MKNLKTKYFRFAQITALLGYLCIVYFSGFHHHVKFVPVPKSESKLTIPQSFSSIGHDGCEICNAVNSSIINLQNNFAIPIYKSKFIISYKPTTTIVYGFKGSAKNLRAPPISIS